MSSRTIQKFEGPSITEAILSGAAKLFSLNYGVWGPFAAEKMGAFAKQGKLMCEDKDVPKETRGAGHVNGGGQHLRRMLVDDELVGNVMATRWVHEGRPMIWITQLCVSSEYRNQGIAKRLETLRREECGVGILSSHPFTLMAVLRVFGCGIEDVDLEMMTCQAHAIMDTCPVGYVKNAEPRGILFEGDRKDGAISCADIGFWVDHEEPLEALKVIREKGIVWPFGDLPDGHEFLVLVKSRH